MVAGRIERCLRLVWIRDLLVREAGIASRFDGIAMRTSIAF